MHISVIATVLQRIRMGHARGFGCHVCCKTMLGYGIEQPEHIELAVAARAVESEYMVGSAIWCATCGLLGAQVVVGE